MDMIETHTANGRRTHFFKDGCLLTTQGEKDCTIIIGDLPAATITRRHAARVLRHLRRA